MDVATLAYNCSSRIILIALLMIIITTVDFYMRKNNAKKDLN